MTSLLLPANATEWEKAVADAAVPQQVVDSAIAAMRGAKLDHPTPSMLPFIVWEFGLGELLPYVPNLYELIADGIDWQRVRGTPLAVAKGLAWLGYAAVLDEAKTSRRYWNAFQLRFTALPANEAPLLERIGGVVALSVPERSRFRRGVYLHDVPIFDLDTSRLDCAMPGSESGIRLAEDGPVWSFSQVHEHEHVLTEQEGIAANIWTDQPFLEKPSAVIDFIGDSYAIGEDTLSRAAFEAAYFRRDGLASTLTMSAAGAVFDGSAFETLQVPVADVGLPGAEGGFVWRGEVDAADDGEWASVIELGGDEPGNLVSVFIGSDGNLSVNVWAGGVYLGGASSGESPVGAGIQTVGVTWQGTSIRIRINNGAIVSGVTAAAFPKATDRLESDNAVADTTVRQVVFYERFLTPGELAEAVDNLISGSTLGPEISDAGGLRWEDADIAWQDADFPWSSGARDARAAALAVLYRDQGTCFVLKDAEGQVIGYRRLRAAHVVDTQANGIFTLGDALFTPTAAAGQVYFEAMTDFGMSGSDVASVALVVGGAPAPGVKPGKLWLDPDEFIGGAEIAAHSVDFPLRETVREQIKLLLRF